MKQHPTGDRDAQTGTAPVPFPDWPSLSGNRPLFLTIELMFLAQLNIIEDGNSRIADLGLPFGRVHHRILYFVATMPGITVGQLLTLLRVSNQNVHRPMGDLVRMGYVEQRTSEVDRRQRHLYATKTGIALVGDLSGLQFDRLQRAFAAVDEETVQGFWRVLWAMIEDQERDWVLSHDPIDK